MGNLFDGLSSSVFSTVANTMGYDAIWHPSDNSDEQFARVLFKDPSVAQKLGPIEFMPNQYVMEYKLGNFTGLDEAINNGSREYVTIEGTDYQVVDVNAIADGRTFRATLEKQ